MCRISGHATQAKAILLGGRGRGLGTMHRYSAKILGMSMYISTYMYTHHDVWKLLIWLPNENSSNKKYNIHVLYADM